MRDLLIVRELLIRGPCRYTDIRNGVLGVAINLLADPGDIECRAPATLDIAWCAGQESNLRRTVEDTT